MYIPMRGKQEIYHHEINIGDIWQMDSRCSCIADCFVKVLSRPHSLSENYRCMMITVNVNWITYDKKYAPGKSILIDRHWFKCKITDPEELALLELSIL